MSNFGKDYLRYASGPQQGLHANSGDVHEPVAEDKPPIIR